MGLNMVLGATLIAKSIKREHILHLARTGNTEHRHLRKRPWSVAVLGGIRRWLVTAGLYEYGGRHEPRTLSTPP